MLARCCPGLLGSGLIALLLAAGSSVWVAASRAQEKNAAEPAAETSAVSDEDAAGHVEAGDASHAAADAHGDEGEGAHGGEAAGAHGGGDAHGAHGGGAHEAGADLSHANPSPSQEAVIDLRVDLAVYTAVVFFLLLAILGKFAWGPITAGLDKREKSIEGMIREAHENAEKATAQLKAYEAQLAGAAEETREMLAKAHRDAEAARERILAEAEQAAQRQRERALADIETAKNVALSEVAQKGADIAVELASQIVRRELRPEDHSQLIKDSLERFPSNN